MRSSRLMISAGILMVGVGFWTTFMKPSAPPDYSTEVVLPPYPADTPAARLHAVMADADATGAVPLQAAATAPATAHSETSSLRDNVKPTGTGAAAAKAIATEVNAGDHHNAQGNTAPWSDNSPNQAASTDGAAATQEAEPAPARASTRQRARAAAKPQERRPQRQASHIFEHPLGTR